MLKQVKNWTRREDAALIRLYRYLWSTRKIGLWYTVARDQLDTMAIEDCMDSDHAGYREVNAKSSSGYACGMGGKDVWAVIVYAHRQQGATARSTAEAELVAASDATFEAAAPLCELWHQVTGRQLDVHGHTDNDASRISIDSGMSRRLSYVRKHQDVSFSAVSAFYAKPGRSMSRVSSEDNVSDIMTKPLDHVAHWRGMRMLGMGIRRTSCAAVHEMFRGLF